VDALAGVGVTAFDGPATAERVWQAMREGAVSSPKA